MKEEAITGAAHTSSTASIFQRPARVLATWAADSISGPDDPATTPALLLDWKNSLLLTASIYSVYPLVLAIALLRQQHRQIDRRALRPPFYSQCFVAAPFALANALAPMPTLIAADRSLFGTLGLMACGSAGALLFGLLGRRGLYRVQPTPSASL